MTTVCLHIQNIPTDSIAILVKISKLQDENAYLIQQLLNSEESFYLDFTALCTTMQQIQYHV